MTNRERVLRCLDHAEADRVPLDIGSLNVTSFHVNAEAKLKAALGYHGGTTTVESFNLQAVVVDERILEHFDADLRVLYARDGNLWAPNAHGRFVDEYGIEYGPSPDGLYYDIFRHPLAEATLDDVERHEFVDPCSDIRTHHFPEVIKRYEDKYALVLDGSRDTIMGVCSWLRGIEQFFVDLALDSPVADLLLEKVTEYQIKKHEHILRTYGTFVDVVKIGDDLGSQQSLLISPEMYRSKIKPFHRLLIKAIKENADCKVVIHSDGSIRELFPDFVEIGIDAVNPIQTSCRGMDPKTVKEEFGKEIVLWGGGVDTQQVLSRATVPEVKAVVKEALSVFKEGGGYIFSQIHNIQPDVPVENVIAMYEAFYENASY